MPRQRPRSSVRATWLVALLMLILPASTVSGADPRSPSAPVSRFNLNAGPLAAKVSPRISKASGPIAAFVEFSQLPAADAFDASLPVSSAAAKNAARAARLGSQRTADSVVSELRSKDSKVRQLYRTTNAASGVAVIADGASLRALAARPDVVSVYALIPKRLANSSAAVLTRVVNSWQSLGVLGTNVKLGVIDSGIDYTHANFGGPGTTAAFKSVNPTLATPLFPSAKVVGGTDFAGENYDASSSDPAQFIPVPDSNPLDCDGHGSHVAGTAAGFGVNANGTTFTGNYRALNASSLANMRIGPGMAPMAKLYALKVFGCPDGSSAGSTLLVGAALDWALDPNADGDFSDHLDVVNISIGADYAAPDDPESKITRDAIKHGVMTVFAGGNGGDLYDIGTGAPEALSVASSRDSRELLDAVQVTAPGSIAGVKPGQYSVALNYDGVDVTKPVVKMTDATNLDGCATFSAADKAKVSGKFVWLEWDDNDATRRCGSAGRSAKAVAAGAAGAILSSSLAHFSGGITGSTVIPVFQLTGPATTQVRPALDAGTLVIRQAGVLRTSIDTFDPTITDTPSAFTARGTRTPGVKPDVAAPGDTITSTLKGSGNGRLSISGTSMASPHVAGIAALLRQLHPSWSPGEIKAAIMNTANHDVYSGEGQVGPIEAPNRVGSGRVDALDALKNKVLAFDDAKPGLVSIGFGIVEVGGSPLTRDRTIEIKNKGTKKVTYRVAYSPITQMPGVTFQLDKTTVTVNPDGTAEVRVRLRIADPTALRKVADPTIAKLQTGLPREFLADASGRVIFTPTSGSTVKLRVPVYAAPKPTAGVTVQSGLQIPGSGMAFLGLTGRGLSQGAGDQAYNALYSVLELGATSPRLPDCRGVRTTNCAINATARGGDLRFVGAASTAPAAVAAGKPHGAMLGFGIATWDNWANIGNNTVPFVDIDTNGDHVPDFEVFLTTFVGTDILVAVTVDLTSGATVDIEAANTQLGDVDTNVFDTNVIVLPVLIDALGINPTTASHRISYEVGVAGFYTAPDDILIDSTLAPISYDPLKPGLWAEGSTPSLLFAALPGTGLTIHKDAASLALDNANSALVLNLHNKSGDRAKVVRITN